MTEEDLVEGEKVWVRQSNCGYQGPAVVKGKVFGSSWLVQATKGDEKILLARAEFLEPFSDKPVVSDGPVPTKEERKEIKRKLKAERKSHRPSGGRR